MSRFGLAGRPEHRAPSRVIPDPRTDDERERDVQDREDAAAHTDEQDERAADHAGVSLAVVEYARFLDHRELDHEKNIVAPRRAA
jgi:hypothetical protein